MKKFLFIAAALGLLTYALWPQFSSLEQMGIRRFEALNRPADEVLVGVCWPFAVNQDGMANGLQLAQDEINSQQLAGEHRIRLVLRDDDFDWQKARRIALEFADTAQMTAVIGYYDDPLAVKASPIYESSRLLHLITGANNTAMTSHEFQYIVRTILASDKIARSLARMSVARGYKKIALVWEEDAYGEDLAYQYRAGLDETQTRIVSQWSYSRTNPDFRLMVNEMKGADADVIFFAGLEPWAGDFLRNARSVGLHTPVIGAFSDTPEMRQRAGSALDGALFFDEYSKDMPSVQNQAFVNKFRARYGKDPDTWAAQGYDALHILAKAIRFTGSRNPLDLSYAIRYMDAWAGANGRYKFTRTGELEDKPLFLKEFRQGIPVVVGQNQAPPLPEP